MLKLVKIISEIKNVSKLTPEIVGKAIDNFFEIYRTRNRNEEKLTKIVYLLAKFEWYRRDYGDFLNDEERHLEFCKQLEKEGLLESFYKDFKQIEKNNNLGEIKNVGKITPKIVIGLYEEVFNKIDDLYGDGDPHAEYFNKATDLTGKLTELTEKYDINESYGELTEEGVETINKMNDETLKTFYLELSQIFNG